MLFLFLLGSLGLVIEALAVAGLRIFIDMSLHQRDASP